MGVETVAYISLFNSLNVKNPPETEYDNCMSKGKCWEPVIFAVYNLVYCLTEECHIFHELHDSPSK